MTPEIFVSYSTKDTTLAEAAREALEARGMRCWIAPRDIAPGTEWSAAIIDAIENSRVFLLVFSAASNESEQVRREVQNAVSQRLPILVFRTEDIPLSKPMRYFLGTSHWLDAVAPPLAPRLTHLAETASRLLHGDGVLDLEHSELPAGEVTLVFTDIEGSSALWESQGEAFAPVLNAHNQLLRDVAERHSGVEVKTEGDAFFLAFQDAADAVCFATETQLAMSRFDWASVLPDIKELRVRIGMHTGVPLVDRHPNGAVDYFGPVVNRAARVGAAGHGGQIIVSDATWQRAQPALSRSLHATNLGKHLLRGVGEETLWQIAHPDLPQEFPPLKTQSVTKHNLPQLLTSFIGREREKAEVMQLVQQSPLVTLCGAGGSGKTRLALEVAQMLLEDFTDGVWLVELEALTAPELVAQTVADVLQVREEAGQSLTDTLVRSLRDKQLLLILDNCEQVVEASARLVQALLRSCPKLRVLATSREVLGVAGEIVSRVPTMPLPNLKNLPPLEELDNYEVVQLFVERATTQLSGFTLTAQNCRAVAEICCRLDGIPLAIELASARIKVMPPEKIAERLNDRFRLLKGGSRTALPRQQTLRAAIDWSYDLLEEAERTLLGRVAIFSGGWTLESAETVCADEELEDYEVLDALSQLTDKSLVNLDSRNRYWLLESVREYGHEKLVEKNEQSSVLARHAQWFLQFAEETVHEGEDNDDAPGWILRLEEEQDNLRAALEYLMTEGTAQDAARLCLAMTSFWERQGWFSESRMALRRCLQREAEIRDMTQRAKLFLTAGWFAYLQGNYDDAMQHQRQSVELYRTAGDEDNEADTLNNMAVTVYAQGNVEQARDWLQSALAIARRSGDIGKQAERLSNLALLEISEKQYDPAQTLLEEARDLCLQGGLDSGTAGCLCNLAELSLRRGDWAAAIDYSRQALQLFRKLTDQRGIAFSLANLAEAASHNSDLAPTNEIEAWLSEALTICVHTGMNWLMPALMETRARWLISCDPTGAINTICAAAQLREQFDLPRSEEEQAEAEKAELALRDILGDEFLNAERKAKTELSGSAEQIIKRLLNRSSENF